MRAEEGMTLTGSHHRSGGGGHYWVGIFGFHTELK